MEQDIDVLKRQMKSLRLQVGRHEEWIDTVSSSFLKRIWWWLQGYRLHKVGRWYKKTDNLK